MQFADTLWGSMHRDDELNFRNFKRLHLHRVISCLNYSSKKREANVFRSIS